MSSVVPRSRFDRFVGAVTWLSLQTGWVAGALAVIMMGALVREVGAIFLQRPHRLGG